MKKKILSLLLIICLMFSMLPEMAFAEGTDDGGIISWGDLKIAISNASTSDNTIITIGADFLTSSDEYDPIRIQGDVQITIQSAESGPFKITRADGNKGSFFTFWEGNNSLTLQNIILDGGGDNLSNAPYSPLIYNGSRIPGTISDLILDSGAILQNNHMNQGNGAAINSEGAGNITMNSGSVIQNNSSDSSGGGLCIMNSNFTMNGGIIRNNTVKGDGPKFGGGVVLYRESIFEMNGGSITGNTAYMGGGIYISGGESTVFNLSAGEITGNTATSNIGGGVYLGSAGFSGDTELNGALMNIKGNPVISGNIGNRNNETIESDLFIQGINPGFNTKPGILRKNGEFTSECSIGVFHMPSSNATILVSDGTNAVTEEDTEFFFSNRETSTIKYDSDLSALVAEESSTAPVITTTSLTDGIVGNAYTQTLVATGNTPITWSVTEGGLPDGLLLDSSTGTISGTPTTVGTFNFTIEAANGTLPAATKALSITIELPQEAEYSTDGGDTWTQDTFSNAITALNSSTSGGTIRLLSDVTLDAAVLINKNITIISSGARTIKRGASLATNSDMIYIRDNGTLALGTEDGMGAGNTLTIDGGAIWSGGEEDSILKRSTNNIGLYSSAGLVWADGSNSTFEMYDGVILQNNDNRAFEGRTVCIGKSGLPYQATFEMHGGEIKNVHANSTVGGVRIVGANATFIMGETAKISGVSSGVQSLTSASGVVLSNGGSFTMNGGTISGNSNIGGNIVMIYGNFTINGGAISGNKTIKNSAGGTDGAAYCVAVANGEFTMTGGEITGNQINHDKGAALYMYQVSAAKLQGNPIIKDNKLGTTDASNIYLMDYVVIQVDGPLTGAAGTIGITSASGKVNSQMTVVTGYNNNKGDNTLPAPFFSDDPTLQLSSNGSGGLKLIPAPTPETKPTASFNAYTMTLSNVSDGMKYSVDGGNTWIDITATSVDISNVITAHGIKVYKVGNGTTTSDSEIQTIPVTQAAAPVSADFNVTQPSSIGGTGSITWGQKYMEFSLDNGNTWDMANGGIVNIPGGTTYLLRNKGTGTVLASNYYSITIDEFSANPEETPLAAIKFETEKLVGLVGSTSYKINGNSINSNEDGEISIDGQWFGGNISIVKQGNNTTTNDSTAQSLNIPARPTMPSPAPETGNGKITNVTTAMEFSQDNMAWRDVTEDEAENGISGINAGTYYVRIKATNGSFASLVTTLTIGTDKIPVTAVSISGTAKVGQTLNATVEPSNATVDYQWQADGTAVGTNAATYTVQAEDIDKTITVTATGTGSYSGTVASDPTVATMTTIEKNITIGTTAPVRDAAVADGINTPPTGATVPTVTWSSDDGANYASASGTFAAAITYKTKYVYTANAGYEFDNAITGNDIIVTNIGSGNKAVQLTNDNKTLTITATWPATDLNPDGANYYSGAPAGTSSEPRTYNIINETQLRDLATVVNDGTTYQYTTFVLQNDIVLSGGDWIPSGNLSKVFNGTFDGNGNEITGIKIGSLSTPESTLFYVGLFGQVGANGTIKNLGIEAEIYTKNYALATGGLVGFNTGTIINSYATGNIAVEKSDIYIGGGIHGGGLVGINTGTITNSYATANVSGVTSNTIGGLVGSHSGNAITNSYATGNVTCTESSPIVGGLVGEILNVSNEIINSYWNNDATQMVNGTARSTKKGVGSGAPDGVISMTSVSMQADTFVETLNANLDILADTALYKWQVKANDYPTFSDTLWSAPAITTINGTVRDKDGNPVTGATVTLTPGAGTQNPATTGNAGQYTINNVPKGNYNVTVTLPNDGGSFTKNITVTGANIDLQQPAELTYIVSGSIKDAADNSPVSGATVTLTNTTNSTKTYSATTNTDGNYTIINVPDGSYAVDVTKNGETYGDANTVITVSGSNVSGGSGNISVTIPTYTVSYNGNGATSGSVTSQTTEVGSTIVVCANGFSKTYFTFAGWNTASDGSGTSYKVNDTFVINGNVTLYAQWKAIDSAQIPIFKYSNVRGTQTVTQPAVANELLVTAEVYDGGTLSYQWYKYTSGTTAGAIAISSATSSSYTPPADVVGTAYYYVVATNTMITQSGIKTSTNTSSVKTVIVLGEPAAVYTVSTNPATLNNITLDDTSATQYQNYTTNIIADTGYYLPDRITVTMGGSTLVDGIDYIYSKTSIGEGTVTVYNVTGEIAITASGALIPATEYTISFNSNGADAPVDAISGNYGDTISLPTPTKAGLSFAGWYRDSGFATAYVSTTMGKENITLFAKWQSITYNISGNVKDEANANVNSASVKLMAGSRQVAQADTDSDGDFNISGVPAGKYNLVITKDDQKITLVITVLNSNLATGSVTLPRGKKNSVLEVKQDTPDIVVDKLNDFFDSEKFTQDDRNVVDAGGMVEIKLSIEIKNESGDNAAANANSIKSSAEGSGNAVGIFLNLTLSKIITPAGGAAEQPIHIDELSDLLIIDIPLSAELQGKNNYVIYRYHDSEVQTITEVVNADGEYIEVSADGKYIKLHAKKFSTYAVGYTTPSTPPANNSGNKAPSTITIEPVEGGRIDFGTDNQTVTITPDNGYAIADVMIDGKSIGSTEKYTLTDSKTHKISAVFVKKTVLPYYDQDGANVYIGFSAVEGNLYKYIAPPNVILEFMENPKNFIDNTVELAKPSIDFVTERELFLGTGQNRFSPNMSMTRSMLVAVIGRLYERSYGIITGASSSTFTDVDVNAYYAKYVVWAYENGLVKGVGNNKFAPDENVTREQMAVIMLNFAKLLNKADVTENPLAYTDSASISAYAIDGAKYCQETNIIVGRSGGNFAPQESATRAEVAAVIERFIKTIMK